MTDIFLSYSSEDRARVIPLVEALQADGLAVWWDRDIRPGPSFDREIEAALDQAGCVVVVWSEHSVESEWVRSEVEEGARLGILVPAVIDQVLPPLAYRRRQSAQLAGWTGDRDHPEYQKLLAGIAATLHGTAPARSNAPRAAQVSPTRHGGAPTPGRISAARGGIGAAIIVAASMGLGWWLSNLADPPAPEPATAPALSVKRTVIPLPAGQTLALADLAPLGVGRRSLAFSPDGSVLAYVADLDGRSQLFLRHMDDFEFRPLAGTEGAFCPFFSPDGRWLGYLTRTHVMRIAVRGGTPQILAEASNVYGADWSEGDRIVFADREGSSLSIISADGSGRTDLPTPEQTYVAHPRFLPGESALLVSAYNPQGRLGIALFDFATREWRTLVANGSAAQYVPTGHLLYSGIDTVMAAPFDLQTLDLEGAATTVLTGVRHEAQGNPQLTVSDDGWMAYLPGPDTRISAPVWRERADGREIPLGLPRNQYGMFTLSPDDSQLAILVTSAASDLWIYDFERATPLRRFTTGGHKTGAHWADDGRALVFAGADASGTRPVWGLYRQALNGSQGEPLLTVQNQPLYVNAWTQDEDLVYSQFDGASEDLLYLNVKDDSNVNPIASTPANEWGASLSPDGRYVAYTSDEAGEYQIYVKRFPPNEDRWIISAGYGEEPIWSDRGDEIFYRRGNQWLSVSVQTTPDFQAGIPRVIFEGSYLNVTGHSYEVSSDAQRFLLLKVEDQPSPTQIRVVSNWFEELERLVPAKH